MVHPLPVTSYQHSRPAVTIHDQDVCLYDLKKNFFWKNAKGMQLYVLNSDQDLYEAKHAKSNSGKLYLILYLIFPTFDRYPLIPLCVQWHWLGRTDRINWKGKFPFGQQQPESSTDHIVTTARPWKNQPKVKNRGENGELPVYLPFIFPTRKKWNISTRWEKET